MCIRDSGDSADAIAGKAMGTLMGIKEAFAFSLSPPSIPEPVSYTHLTLPTSDLV